MKQLVILVFLAFLPVVGFNQAYYNDNPNFSEHISEKYLDTSLNNIFRQTLLFPQEKIYIQTDKPYYILGEKLYFRAFLINSFMNLPSPLSRYIYIELVNPLGVVVNRQQIRSEEKFFYGAISLPYNLPQGDYKIRAYTRLMTNMSEDYFYTQYIHIADPRTASIETIADFSYSNDKQVIVNLKFLDSETKAPIQAGSVTLELDGEKKENKKLNNNAPLNVKFDLNNNQKTKVLLVELSTNMGMFRQFIPIPYPKDEYSVSFYPEGGNLIAGQPSKVAFKALKSNGNSLKITGTVYNSKGYEIASLSTLHDGMGLFTFIPEIGERYYALCYDEKKDSITINLPEIRHNSFALKAEFKHNQLQIDVNKSDESQWQKMYLLIYSGGIPVYFKEWNNKEISIDKSLLFSGISNIYLLAEDFSPISKRLIFNLNKDWATAEINTNKKSYKKREFVSMNIEVTDYDILNPKDINQPEKEKYPSSFSISITSDRNVVIDTTSNILSEILLSSELPGYISNSAYYFQKDNPQAAKAADLLMMVNGWSRYDIPAVMQGNIQHAKISAEESHVISGIVKGNGLLEKPYEGAKVMLIAKKTMFMMDTITGADGKFVFKNFEFPDSTEYMVQATNQKGKKNVILEIDPIIYPRFSNSLNYFNEGKDNNPIFMSYLNNSNQIYAEGNSQAIMLPGAVITKKKKEESKYKTRFPVVPSYSLEGEELEKMPKFDAWLLISSLPGVTVIGNSISLNRMTNQKTLRQASGESNEDSGPLIYLDGMELTDPSTISSLMADDIGRIALIKNEASLISYGLRAAGRGVIEIMTKSGAGVALRNAKPNIKNGLMFGYKTPAEFYSPKYDTPKAINNPSPDLRTTIYWKPNVEINEHGKADIEFYTADNPTSYSVVIEGITSEGTLIYHREKAVILVE